MFCIKETSNIIKRNHECGGELPYIHTAHLALLLKYPNVGFCAAYVFDNMYKTRVIQIPH